MTADRTRRMVFSSSVGIGQRLLQALSALITIPVALHALGTAGFGIWGAAASLAWMVNMVDFGLGNSLLTAVARSRGNGDNVAARTQIGAALGVTLALAVAFVGSAGFVIQRWSDPDVAGAYLMATFLLGLNIPLSLAANIWLGLQKGYVAWSWEAVQTIAVIVAFVGLSTTDSDPRLFVAATFGALVISNAASFTHLMIRHPELRPTRIWISVASVGELLRRGLPYFVLGLTTALAVHSDNIVALAVLGPDAAGHMAVVQRACMTALGLLWVLAQPLWPAFTDAAVRTDISWIRSHIFRGAAVVFAAAVAGSAFIVLAGRPLMHIWLGGALDIDQRVLWAMAAWIIVPALCRIPDLLLNALGVVWFQVIVALIYSSLAFALKLILAPSLGISGILLGTAISYGLTHLPAYQYWLWKWIGTTGKIQASGAISEH